MKIRIATWNIAAAHRMLSLERSDVSKEEDLDYFIEQFQHLNLDVICLQESHINGHDSMAKRIANMLNMTHVQETPGCPSDFDSTYNITTAIITKELPIAHKVYTLPHPNFELRFTHNNRVVPPYNRHMQLVRINDLTVATTHTEPLGAFGLRYDKGTGKALGEAIDTIFAEKLNSPLLFAADLNMCDALCSLPMTTDKYKLKDALPNEPTKPHGTRPDHILYSPELSVSKTGIMHTETDHYLCWAEFVL